MFYTKGRMALAMTGGVSSGQTVTYRVYIGQDSTTTIQNSATINQRERIAKLVRQHGRRSPRRTLPVESAWQYKPGFLEAATMNHDYPETQARDLWDNWGDRFGAMICWGQMSFRTPSSALTGQGVFDGINTTTVTSQENIFEDALVGTTLSVIDVINGVSTTIDSFTIESVLSTTQATTSGNHSFTNKRIGTETGCCQKRESLHCRNSWMLDSNPEGLVNQIKSQSGLFAVYAIPRLESNPATIESWLCTNSLLFNALYGDTLGYLTKVGDFDDFPSMMIEHYTLAYPHAALVSGTLSGGTGSFSKRATDCYLNSCPTADPGESRANTETGLAQTPWVKTAFWLGMVFKDADVVSNRPTRCFLGEQNNDGTYPDWTFSTAFMTGCGIAPIDPDCKFVPPYPGCDQSALITGILDEWERTSFFQSNWRYVDRIGLQNWTPGVDVRRFENDQGGAMLAVDQQAGGTLTNMHVTVDGVPRCIALPGRVALISSPFVSDCDDLNACTTDSCDASGCVHTTVECDDGIACTIDSCNPSSGCVFTPNDAACDDGDFCTGVEDCSPSLGCVQAPVVCNDGVACTIDSCDASSGCIFTPDNAACDDGVFCNGVEVCSASSGCQAGADPCPSQSCDEGLDECVTLQTSFWMAFASDTVIPGVGTVKKQDVVAYHSIDETWSMIFDGSDVGLGSLAIDGLAVLPGGDILLSFTTPGTVPGLTGGPAGTAVDGADIVRFTPTSWGETTAGTFSFYFDGSDVGLDTTSENVDAIAVAADGRLIVSTVGNFSANGASGADTASGLDEDLFIFNATSLEDETAGWFAMYFDGSDVELDTTADEDVDALAIWSYGGLLLSTVGSFSVTGVSGADEDAFEFTPTQLGATTSGNYVMVLPLSVLGIDPSANIMALELAP